MILRQTIAAFATHPDSLAAMQALTSDPLLARASLLVRSGGLADAIALYQDHPSPDCLIVEDSDSAEILLQRLEQLANHCQPHTRVIVIGRVNDIALYRHLLAQGVSEYLVGPVTSSMLVTALETLYGGGKAGKGRLLLVAGLRGGTGASALAQTLAVSLASRQPGDVLLADLDLRQGTVGLAFDLEPRQTILDLLRHGDRIDGQLLERTRIKLDDGLSLLPAPTDPEDSPVVTLEAIDALMETLRQSFAWSVLDLPCRSPAWGQHLLEQCDACVLVACPDLMGLRDAKAMMDRLKARRSTPPLLVLNRIAGRGRGQISVKDFTDTLKLPIAARLPEDPEFGEALSRGRPPGAGASAATRQALDALISQIAPPVVKDTSAGPGGGAGRWLQTLTTALRRKDHKKAGGAA